MKRILCVLGILILMLGYVNGILLRLRDSGKLKTE